MAVITDNPDPAEFPLSCVGDTPRVDVSLESDEKGVCKGLTFERLLLDKTDSQTFAITNTCLLPVAWILAGCDALPKEVTISPESGVLAARSTVEVTVELHAIEKKIINERVTLQIRDVKEVLPVAQEVPIPIVGEAYKIEVDVKFPEEGVTGIDFGTVKVVDDHVKTITIQNTGAMSRRRHCPVCARCVYLTLQEC
jgi:hydrocephalus-inducing protein